MASSSTLRVITCVIFILVILVSWQMTNSWSTEVSRECSSSMLSAFHDEVKMLNQKLEEQQLIIHKLTNGITFQTLIQ